MTDTITSQERESSDYQSEEHPAAYYLREEYRQQRRSSMLLKTYYALRPLMPRALQLAMRRRYARRQASAAFPRWPIEPILVEKAHRELQVRIERSAAGRVPLINFWPGTYRAAVVLTHDVEGERGVRNIPRVRALERQYGVVSSWNFVAERYPFDKIIFDELRADGCEIGLHGLYHDGRKFSSRAIFEERLPKMKAYMKQWGAVGFRSPATHRNAAWMPEIGAEYDSSFPDTDPFEPQPGGCCSIFPFFLGDMVELPITLVQDHTLIEILQKPDIELWKEKSNWIIHHHGLVNIIIHPDYMLTENNLRYYEEFLRFIRTKNNIWFALPMEVARWWRSRAQSTIIMHDGAQPVIDGPARDRGTLAWAELNNNRIEYKFDQAVSSSYQPQSVKEV